jgi:hypothetical protein
VTDAQFSNWRITDCFWCVTLVIAYGLASFFWGEKVPTARGLGWDGQIYADIIRNLPNIDVSVYYAHRLLLPTLVWFVAPDTSTISITTTFNLLQIGVQAASVLLWFRVAKRFSRAQKLLGFSALFLNFEALKFTHFNVVSVDATAILLSLVMLAVRHHRNFVSAISILSSFTWQMGTLTGAMLLALCPTNSKGIQISIWLFWAALAIGIIGFISFSVVDCPALPIIPGRGGTPDFLCHAGRAVFTGFPSWVLFGIAALQLIPFGRIRSIALPIVVIALPAIIAHILANPAKTAGGTIPLLAEMAITPAEGFFLLPLVSIVIFWGPLALLAMLRWSRVAEIARSEALAAPLILGLVLALPTEPRYITFAWPILVYCTVKAYPDISERLSLAFGGLSLALSKVWLPLTAAPWPITEAPTDQFPLQYYFLSLGYWMIPSTFWPQALVVALLTLAFHRLLRSTVAKQPE